jgi:hypothetical protein
MSGFDTESDDALTIPVDRVDRDEVDAEPSVNRALADFGMVGVLLPAAPPPPPVLPGDVVVVKVGGQPAGRILEGPKPEDSLVIDITTSQPKVEVPASVKQAASPNRDPELGPEAARAPMHLGTGMVARRKLRSNVAPIILLTFVGVAVGLMMPRLLRRGDGNFVTNEVATTAPSHGPIVSPINGAGSNVAASAVRIETHPSGASVTLMLGNESGTVGTTPLTAAIDTSRNYDAVVALDGWQTKRVRVPGSVSLLTIDLEPDASIAPAQGK